MFPEGLVFLCWGRYNNANMAGWCVIRYCRNSGTPYDLIVFLSSNYERRKSSRVKYSMTHKIQGLCFVLDKQETRLQPKISDYRGFLRSPTYFGLEKKKTMLIVVLKPTSVITRTTNPRTNRFQLFLCISIRVI